MAKFKGTIFLSVKLYTERRFGPEAAARVLAELPDSDRQLLSSVVPVGWYPSGPVMAYHRKLDELYGKGDRALVIDLGRFSADWAVNTILKFLIRFKSPDWLMNRSATLWDRYHDTGRWEHAPTSEYPILSRLYDFEVMDPLFCARFQGWLARATELTGGRDPNVTEPKCATRGDGYCEFRVKWT